MWYIQEKHRVLQRQWCNKVEDQGSAPPLTEKQSKAIDLLYEAMIFWHAEGQTLIKQLIYKLNIEGEGRVAAQIAKQYGDIEARWSKFAETILPYQESKKASITVNKTETKRFVIEAPRVVANKHEWAELVAKEQALLPKHDVIHGVNNADSSIDDAEFIDVNAN